MNGEKIKHLFDIGWYNKLLPFIESKQFDDIIAALKEEKKNGFKVFPYDKDCFNAFLLCPYNKTRIIVLGMDPYHNTTYNNPVAHGLAFSYKRLSEADTYIPPSLRNILKEVEADYYQSKSVEKEDSYVDYLITTDLTRWAEQGVLLLNTALTVRQNEPGSHLKLWEPFTLFVLNILSEFNNGLIYMLWGNDAQQYESKIHPNNYILKAGHPSPLNTKNPFRGCKHFTQANKLLEQNNGIDQTIVW